jgi:hypothetical protein
VPERQPKLLACLHQTEHAVAHLPAICGASAATAVIEVAITGPGDRGLHAGLDFAGSFSAACRRARDHVPGRGVASVIAVPSGQSRKRSCPKSPESPRQPRRSATR